MRKLKDLNYGIVGLGIMGGSIAKAIRQNILSQNGSSGKIYACNRSTACLSQAKSEGVVTYFPLFLLKSNGFFVSPL